jgi:hypothetical protein
MHGEEYEFDAVEPLMDQDILAQLRTSPGTNEQALFEAYAEAHAVKFGQAFAPFTGGHW